MANPPGPCFVGLAKAGPQTWSSGLDAITHSSLLGFFICLVPDVASPVEVLQAGQGGRLACPGQDLWREAAWSLMPVPVCSAHAELQT